MSSSEMEDLDSGGDDGGGITPEPPWWMDKMIRQQQLLDSAGVGPSYDHSSNINPEDEAIVEIDYGDIFFFATGSFKVVVFAGKFAVKYGSELFAKEAIEYVSSKRIPEVLEAETKNISPASQAIKWQGTGDYPGIDKWNNIILKKCQHQLEIPRKHRLKIPQFHHDG